MSHYTTNERMTLQLGEMVGKGGEGTVHAVKGDEALVAKVYHHDRERERKLQAMVPLYTEQLAKFATWPRQLIYDENEEFVGYTMAKLTNFTDIHLLYSPSSRQTAFPNVTLSFLLHVALNVAKAFAVVHHHGLIIGDVNERNILVSKTGIVQLIDCDSFQLEANGTTFYCPVGVRTHLSPELQHLKRLDGVKRTKADDCFGLAVILFHLLYMGRHPFSGKYLGEGDMPIHHAIRDRRFAYGEGAKERLMEPPHNSIPYDIHGEELTVLFDRAFLTKQRPSAMEWAKALSAVQQRLTSCGAKPGHVYHDSNTSCPWCAYEQEYPIQFFLAVSREPKHRSKTTNVDVVWQRIEKLELTMTPYEPKVPVGLVPTYEQKTLERDIMNGQRLKLSAIVVNLLIVLAGGLLWQLYVVVPAMVTLMVLLFYRPKALRTTLKEAERQWLIQQLEWGALQEEWDNRLFVERFYTLKQQLATDKALYDEQPKELKRVKDMMILQTREFQLARHLRQRSIVDESIKGVGQMHKATLLSYGIATAADINEAELRLVPGLSEPLIEALIGWRRYVEKKFIPNLATYTQNPQYRAKQQEGRSIIQKCTSTIKDGERQLKEMQDEHNDYRQQLIPIMDETYRAYEQARINAEYVRTLKRYWRG